MNPISERQRQSLFTKKSEDNCETIIYTVMLIEMPHFQYIYYSSTIIRAILLIFNIFTVYSLYCTNLKYEQKIIKKMNDQQYMYKICTLLRSFGQKMYGPKVLNILPFRFFGSFFLRFFDDSVRAFSQFQFRTKWSEMNLYFYHHKMVIMKY